MKRALIALALGLAALAFGTQAQAGPTGQPATPTPTPTLFPTVTGARPTFLPGQPPVPALPNTSMLFRTCGTLVEAMGGAGDPQYVLSVMATAEIRIRVRLVGRGTAPSDLVDRFVRGTPQIVTISGTAGVPNSATPDAHTITDFVVTRVASCTLPSTSTK